MSVPPLSGLTQSQSVGLVSFVAQSGPSQYMYRKGHVLCTPCIAQCHGSITCVFYLGVRDMSCHQYWGQTSTDMATAQDSSGRLAHRARLPARQTPPPIHRPAYIRVPGMGGGVCLATRRTGSHCTPLPCRAGFFSRRCGCQVTRTGDNMSPRPRKQVPCHACASKCRAKSRMA